MPRKKYRLDDRIITGYDDFFYTWEKNMAMGEHRIGNCFVIGDILIFEPWTQQKEGCLQLEFSERLKKLPAWDITQYYCASANLRDVGTGQLLLHFCDTRKQGENLICFKPSQTFEDGVFRLGRHKINVEKNGEITWQRFNKPNNIIGGRGFIVSGILFLGPGEKDVREIKSKKTWYKDLGVLPKWDKTFAWSRQNFLHRVAPQAKIKRSFWQKNGNNTATRQSIRSSKPRYYAKPDQREPIFSDFVQKKKPWRQRSVLWEKRFNRFASLVMGVFCTALYITGFILKKTVDMLGVLWDFFKK